MIALMEKADSYDHTKKEMYSLSRHQANARLWQITYVTQISKMHFSKLILSINILKTIKLEIWHSGLPSRQIKLQGLGWNSFVSKCNTWFKSFLSPSREALGRENEQWPPLFIPLSHSIWSRTVGTKKQITNRTGHMKYYWRAPQISPYLSSPFTHLSLILVNRRWDRSGYRKVRKTHQGRIKLRPQTQLHCDQLFKTFRSR